jgi:pyruvate dehydrogenase E1 component
MKKGSINTSTGAHLSDIDPDETKDWLDSLESILRVHGPDRAHQLLSKLVDHARRSGAYLPYTPNTAYVNTLPLHLQPEYPGNKAIERKIEAYIRWNAMVMVVKANKISSEYGGHIASYASSATLYEVGFNHFWRAPTKDHGGDMIFIQGHSSPGIYARAFLEGRLNEGNLNKFRQEAGGKGLSSYPHPWLMPDFWQFPTVSMGLGPMMAIYQARFMKYLQNREILPVQDRKVWCFLGDGETDEPESMGALTLPSRESLDNLVFVVNCNLQRLDGPVRGNGKIVQELEAAFLGAGWNVLKVLWGSRWDPLISKDHDGALRQVMTDCVDGEYQNYKAKGGAYTREHFFGKDPRLLDMVSHLTDDQIWRLNRGGHDPFKVHAAYRSAMDHKGRPTVILAKTVKGYGMGMAGEGQNATHQKKKLDENDLKAFRNRFDIPVTDKELSNLPYYKPKKNSEEIEYLQERRSKLGGYLPQRLVKSKPVKPDDDSIFDSFLEGSGDREVSTTMVVVRILSNLVKDKKVGSRIVPIVPDEARTFGMEGMFRQVGIYSAKGQLYTPHDADQLMYYREDLKGQILEEGINEAGAFCSWLAAATAYSNHDHQMIPFYIYYSMFGFQRIGDFAWAGGDLQARGFLLGGTAGRTTLAGEGLQHQDGHSLLIATTIPNCKPYDPCFGYELAVIIKEGMRRMNELQENIFYFITCMNENYLHPAMPAGAEEGIIKGMYHLMVVGESNKVDVQLFGSGTILREVIKAAELLQKDYGLSSQIWSITSYAELRQNGLDCERNKLRSSGDDVDLSYVEDQLKGLDGPFIAASDYMRTVTDQIRQWIPGPYYTLGTDGFGRSDSRHALRQFFEVDAESIAYTSLRALYEQDKIDLKTLKDAAKRYKIDISKPNPVEV